MDIWNSLNTCIIRGEFTLPCLTDKIQISLWPKSLGEKQTMYINGHLIADGIKRDDPVKQYQLDHSILHKGENSYVVVATPFIKRYQYDNLNTDPCIIQVRTPASTWKRKVFNGLAQIIVQSSKEIGEIVLTATSKGLSAAEIRIHTEPCKLLPEVQSAIQTK